MSVVIDMIHCHSGRYRTSECFPKQTMNKLSPSIDSDLEIIYWATVTRQLSVPYLRIYSAISADEISVESRNRVVVLSVNYDMWMRITL